MGTVKLTQMKCFMKSMKDLVMSPSRNTYIMMKQNSTMRQA